MEERLNDIRVRTTLSIFRLYPAWKQDNSADCKAWIEANKAHGERLAADPEADIDEGWPDPATWTPIEQPKKTNLEKAIEQNGKEEPPAEIADIYEAYGMDPDALFKLHTDLTSKIAGNMQTSDYERSLQSRLTPHVPWLRQRAKSVEVVG